MKKYYCTVCGETFELEDGAEIVCPVCGVGEELLEVVED